MRQAAVWFWLSCRRYLRRISFAAILLLLPVGAYVLHLAEKSGDNRIPVAVCVADLGTGTAGSGREIGRGTGQAEEGTLSMQGADMEAGEGTGADLAVRLLKSLTDEQRDAGDGMFVFYACDSVEQVKDEVASRRAECGYAITSDLGERMAENDYKRSIRVYSAPTTVTAQLSQEVVFAELAALYDRELFLEYVEQGAAFDFAGEPESAARQDLAARAGERYDAWFGDGSTFQFVYEVVETTDGEMADDPSGMSFPIRGLAALLVYLTGIYSAAMGAADQKRGLFLPVSWKNRTLCRIASLGAPVALAACSALGAILAGGSWGHTGRELAAMVLYTGAVLIFSWLLCLICREPGRICMLLPFFLMGSLIFCPIFLDAGRFLPEAEWIGKLFLPWYYLRWM